MSEWKESKLKDVTIFIKDGTHGTHKDFPDGIPLLSAKDIENGKILIPDNCRTVSESDYKLLHSNYEIENDDLLLTVVGTIGRVAIAKKLSRKITFQRSVSIIRIDKSKLLPDYSFHYFQSFNFQQTLERSKNASAQGGVYLGELAKTRIFHPFLPSEQKKIAHILTTCDTVIEQTQSAIAKYKAIKQGLLHDLFTRGLDANGHLRPSYQDSPDLYKESELGMIPKEWEVKRLGDVINAIDPQPDHRTPESIENGIPYLGINDIDNFGKIDLRKCRKVSTEILEEHKKRYQIRNGDIIFGKIGTIGEPKRLNNFNNLTLSANVILIQPQGIADYIYWYFLSESVNKQINNSIHTTSQPAFGMDKIRSLIIPMCDDIEQNEIAKRLNAIDNKIQTEETLLQKYQSIKRGLMGDLLGGRKEVKQ